jgi:pimeloyl-ACP methyl ester carboxylesterase
MGHVRLTTGSSLWLHERGPKGPVIVLIHPGPGADGSVFFPWFDALADRYHVVAPDLPGHGRSEDGDRRDWTLDGCAAAIHDLAITQGWDAYTIIGHSFGSWVALSHAIKYPGEADRIVASCGAAWLEGDVLAGLEQRIQAL